MAGEVVSQLALDATKVFSAIEQLQTYLGKLNQSFQAVAAGGIANFNQAEASMGPAIAAVNAQLSEQAKFAATAAVELRNVFTGRIDSSATLAEIKKVNDAFAQLERTLISTKATPDQISNIVNNLKGKFTGTDAQIQSALIAAKNASDQLGGSNATSTLKINQAAIKGNADALAKAEALALAQSQAALAKTSATQLGSQFNTAGASTQALAAYQSALVRYQDVVQKSGLSSTQLQSVLGNLGQTYTGVEGKVAAAALTLQKFGQQLQDNSLKAQGFGANLQSLVQIFTFQLALRGLGALQQAFTDSIGKAIEFERAIAQVTTISGAGEKNIDSMAQKVNDLANEFGKPNIETATGLYHAYSNQVGDSAQTTQFFIEALKFSKSAVTDVSSSVDALSAVQNAYGQTSATASHNADVLFRTIDLGRVSAKELGDSFGRILPIASQLGITLEEVSAAISTATVQGVKFQDAQTQILNLLIATLKPTTALKEQIHDLGYASAEAGFAAEGFIGFFKKIGDTTDHTTESLAKLFPNIRGLRGELSLFGDQGKRLTDFLQQTKDSAEAAQKAFDTIQFSNAETVSNEMARIQNQITQGFGRDAIAVLAALNTAFGGVANTIVTLGELLGIALGAAVFNNLSRQLVAFAASAALHFGAAGASVTAFSTLVGGLVPVLTGLGLVAFATYKLLKPPDYKAEFDKFASESDIAGAKRATIAANQIRDANKGFDAAQTEQVQALLQGLQEQQAALNSAYRAAQTIESATTDNFKNEISQRLKAYTNFLNSIEDLQHRAATNAADLANKQAQFTQSIQDAEFTDKLGRATPKQKVKLIPKQIDKLLSNAQVNQAAGNDLIANSDIQKAKDLALQFEHITRSRKEIIIVEQAYTKYLADGQAILEKQLKTGKELQDLNAPNAQEAKIQLELVKNLVEEYQKIGKAQGFNSKAAGDIKKQLDEAIVANKVAEDELTTGVSRIGKNAGSKQQQATIDALLKIRNGPNLADTVESGVQRFLADVQNQLDKQSVKVAIDGDTTELQNKIVKLNEQAKKRTDLESAIGDSSGGQEDAVGRSFTKIEELFRLLKDAKSNSLLSDHLGMMSATDEDRAIVKVREFNAALAVAERNIYAVFADPKSFNEFDRMTAEAIKKLGEIQQPIKDLATQDKAFAGLAESINETILKTIQLKQTLLDTKKGFDDATDAAQKLKDINDQKNPVQKDPLSSDASILNQSIIDTANSVINLNGDLLNLGPTTTTATSTAVEGITSIGAAADTQIASINALISAIGALSQVQAQTAPPTVTASRGGQFLASGGQAIGTDTIPAMLSPGEIVMNAGVSRKFFSQLMAMNSGVQPQYRANGGAVGDTFGDINVNINAGGPSNINARDIAQGIRRELRRSSIRSLP